MNLKRLFLLSAAAWSLAGCGVSDSPILITNAAALEQGCSFVSNAFTYQGSLNLAIAEQMGARSVSWPFFLESHFQEASGTEGANHFIADSIQLSYRFEPAAGSLQPVTVPVHAVVSPGTGGEASYLYIPLLPSTALEELKALGLDETGAVLYVTFTVSGRTNSGRAVKSNQVSFPIEVFNAAPAGTCPDGSAPQVVAACGALNATFGCP